jgi:NADH:ubiquinone oxidoreductase subunit
MLKYFGKIFGIRHKVLVGRDRFGNKYYAIEEAEVTRRIIETKDGDYPSPETIHPLWHLWLKSRIPYPPTEKEIEAYDEEQRQLKIRVREYEEKDAKLRLEEMAQRQREGRTFNDDYSPNQALQQLLSKMHQDETNISSSIPSTPSTSLSHSSDPFPRTSPPRAAPPSSNNTTSQIPPKETPLSNRKSPPSYQQPQPQQRQDVEAWVPPKYPD